MTTYYIAGPMRGIPHFNFPAFDAAHDRLKAAGHTAVSPANLDRARDGLEGLDAKHAAGDPATLPNGFNPARRDVEAILYSDVVAVLEGWERSTGARTEIAIARWLGLPIVWASDLSPIPDAGHPGYIALLQEMELLHRRKAADYGRQGDPYANVRASENWGIPAWVGAMIRANDKIARLQAAAQGSRLQNEGIEDSLMDLAAYALIALCLYREAA